MTSITDGTLEKQRNYCSEDDIRIMLRSAVGEKRGDIMRFAHKHGIHPSIISEVLHGRRAPAGRILDALKVRKVVKYVVDEPTRA